MATIQIADNDARVQYTQAVVANTTQLTIDYPFFSLDDINVIVTNAAGTDTVLTRGTGTGTFAVVGVAVDDGFSGGYITLGDSYSAGTDTFTIFRDIPVERTTDFPTSGPFNISSLNTELDKIIAIEQELETQITRTLQLSDSDTTVNLKLPSLNTRKGTTLAFNTITGEPEAGPTVSGITTVTDLAADITTLADIEDGTVATDAISDTAAIAADVTTVGGIASNVTTVASVAADVTTVANNITEVTTFSQVYRVGATDPTSNNDVGDLFYNTTSDILKVWNGGSWVIAASEVSGYLPVTGGTITGDLTLSGGSGADILFDQSEKLLLFKNATKAAFGSIPSSSANPNTADIEIYRNNLESAVIGFADTSTAGGTKIPSFIKNLTADVNYIQFTPTQDVALFYNGVEKFATENTGVGVIGDINVSGLVDGRDVAADGTKLDGIEASADVTDAGNVNPLVDAHLNQSTAASGEVLSWNGSDYDWIAAAGGGGDLLAANNLSDLASASTARSNLGLGTAATTASTDYATAAQGTTADAALPRTGGAMTGAITTNSTFDGRDVATDGAKLDGIAAGANNYVHPNHTGEVTSTADGATVIADNVVDEANLKVSNAPTNGYALTAQSGAAGGLTWAAVSGGSYSDSDVDTHLNTSTAATNEVLSWTGSDYDWVAQSGGGGADLYAANEISPTAQPSATGNNAIAIGDGAVSSGGNSIAIGFNSESSGSQTIALGAGRSSGAVGSVAIGGFGSGYSEASNGWAVAIGRSLASGNTSLAINIGDNTASYGSAGQESVAIGKLAKTVGTNTLAIGARAQTTGASAIAIGHSYGNYGCVAASGGIAIGDGNNADAIFSTALGYRAKAATKGKFAFAVGQFAAQGDAQGGMYILRADTTDATATVLTTNNATADADNQIVAASDTCITFDGTITAMQNGAQSYASWRIEGLLVNDGGTTTVANSAITVIDNQSSWGLTLTADNTNNALAITFTGEAAHNIRTVANIRTTEVTYA